MNESSQTTIYKNNNSDEFKALESNYHYNSNYNYISPKGHFKLFNSPTNSKNTKLYFSKIINNKQNIYLPKISKKKETNNTNNLKNETNITNNLKDKIDNKNKTNTKVLIKIMNFDLKKKKLEKKFTSINLRRGENKKLMRYKSSNHININNQENKDFKKLQKISPKRQCLSIRLTNKIIGDIFL